MHGITRTSLVHPPWAVYPSQTQSAMMLTRKRSDANYSPMLHPAFYHIYFPLSRFSAGFFIFLSRLTFKIVCVSITV